MTPPQNRDIDPINSVERPPALDAEGLAEPGIEPVEAGVVQLSVSVEVGQGQVSPAATSEWSAWQENQTQEGTDEMDSYVHDQVDSGGEFNGGLPTPEEPAKSIIAVEFSAYGLSFNFLGNHERFDKRFKDDAEGKLLASVGLVSLQIGEFITSADDCTQRLHAIINKGRAGGRQISADQLRDMIDDSTERGLLSVNGNGPGLTEEGMKQLILQAGDKFQRAKIDGNQNGGDKIPTEPAKIDVETGEPGLIDEISAQEQIVPIAVRPKKRTGYRQYQTMSILIDQANGRIRTEGNMGIAIKTLAMEAGVDLTEAESLRDIAGKIRTRLVEEDMAVETEEDGVTTLQVTPKGIAVYNYYKSDPRRFVSKESRKSSLGETAVSILERLEGGYFTLDGEEGWIYGRNSDGDVFSTLAQDVVSVDWENGKASPAYDRVSRRLFALRAAGMVEVKSSSFGLIVNARLTAKGKGMLERSRAETRKKIEEAKS